MSYNFDEKTRTLTVDSWGEMYDFGVDTCKAGKEAKKDLPKKLVINSKRDAYQTNLINMLRKNAFKYLEEIEICKENKYVKAVDNIIYTADDEELLVCLKSKRGKVVIPEGVETICDNAFGFSEISEVVLPESLRTIEHAAFTYCKNLKSIDTKNVERIESNAFYESSLRGVKFGNALRRIDIDAFYSTQVETITLPEGFAEIATDVFRNSSLKEVFLPASIQYVGTNAFGDAAEKIHIKSYSFNILDGLLRYDYVTDGQKSNKHYKKVIVFVTETGKEIVIPKYVNLHKVTDLNRRLGKYFESGDESRIENLFKFAIDDGCREYVAMETFRMCKSTENVESPADNVVHGLNVLDLTSHVGLNPRSKSGTSPQGRVSKSAVKFLNQSAVGIANRCESDDDLIDCVKLNFWTEDSLRDVLGVAEEKGFVQASAYILQEIGKRGKKSVSLSL